jgi:hypothetical protein
MLHYSDSDLTDSGQEGTEAQEKVTYSRTGRKIKQPVMIFYGQQI